MPSPVALSILATRIVSKRASKSALSGHEQQTPSSSGHFPTTLIGRQLVRTCWSTNITPPLSCQTSAMSPTVDRKFLAGSQRSCSPIYVGMVDTSTLLPAHLATNMTAGRDNEQADAMPSLRNPQIGRGQIYLEGCCSRSWEGNHDHDERSNDLPTLLEQPRAGSPLCDASNPNSETEGPTINGPAVYSIEDNTLKHTIPMIREVSTKLQEAAKGFEDYLPRNNIVNAEISTITSTLLVVLMRHQTPLTAGQKHPYADLHDSSYDFMLTVVLGR
ncbi:hypothetical protein PILCRDRAFT_92208 [Piloderma croceum F 1598]|uniref:Uncharacterized protein n=1 Tax=Piloderma croceum (strain F 1598) TaxID=765440 RepID=A0A0C3F5T1_PILCF|nr:hypothetical protein PILCRDRAFT_92208 [Piloderma croceum F 1598]